MYIMIQHDSVGKYKFEERTSKQANRLKEIRQKKLKHLYCWSQSGKARVTFLFC